MCRSKKWMMCKLPILSQKYSSEHGSNTVNVMYFFSHMLVCPMR